MVYNAKIFKALIASPGDVQEERKIVEDVIHEWNAIYSENRGIIILPVKWETHSSPELGDRPQAIINRDVVDDCDFLIGVFWTRIGSPTGVAESGTIEEIQRMASSGKIIMLYFSKAKVELDKVDLDQYQRLRAFRQQISSEGLVESYGTLTEFRNKLSNQLELKSRQLETMGVATDTSLDEMEKSQVYLHFIDIDLNEAVGPRIELIPINIECTDFESIPDYKDNVEDEAEKSETIIFNFAKNRNFYREFVRYIEQSKRVKPFGFAITNTGSKGVRDLFIEIIIEVNKTDLLLMKEHQVPQKPQRYSGGDLNIFTGSYNSAIRGDDSYFSFDEIEKGYKISFSLRALQPQRTVFFRDFLYVGSEKPCSLNFIAKIFADSISPPLTQVLTLDLEPKEKKLSYENILSENLGEY
ncbi:MAG: hypothetical protein ABIG63_09970 [Chloroflexota bacterium]